METLQTHSNELTKENAELKKENAQLENKLETAEEEHAKTLKLKEDEMEFLEKLLNSREREIQNLLSRLEFHEGRVSFSPRKSPTALSLSFDADDREQADEEASFQLSPSSEAIFKDFHKLVEADEIAGGGHLQSDLFSASTGTLLDVHLSDAYGEFESGLLKSAGTLPDDDALELAYDGELKSVKRKLKNMVVSSALSSDEEPEILFEEYEGRASNETDPFSLPRGSTSASEAAESSTGSLDDFEAKTMENPVMQKIQFFENLSSDSKRHPEVGGALLEEGTSTKRMMWG